MDGGTASQDERFRQAQVEFGPALERLARAYEADRDLARDLFQDIQVELWRSLAIFDGRCSLRTWAFRVAHLTAAGHVTRRRRIGRTVGLEELELAADGDDPEATVGDRRSLARLTALIHQLVPADRQVVLLYLEGLEAAEIGEVTGLTENAVSVKIHRLKAVLARQFHAHGGAHD
jgi:RNA polymerase sigma-70 factor (ECF subfamily)